MSKRKDIIVKSFEIDLYAFGNFTIEKATKMFIERYGNKGTFKASYIHGELAMYLDITRKETDEEYKTRVEKNKKAAKQARLKRKQNKIKKK